MRFMVIVKATADSEAGVMPSEELLMAMGRYNEELAAAGVMLAGEGLHPSSRGALLDLSVRVAAGVHRLGQALPKSHAWRVRYRDSADLRGRGFRRRVHPRIARAGRPYSRAHQQ